MLRVMRKERPKPDVRKNVGERIKARRKWLNYTQEELSRFADIARSTLARIERGETQVRIETLESIARALKVKMEDLVKGVD